MLKKRERLTRAAFSRSFAIGKRYHSPSVQLIVAPGDSFHGSVVVGKKVYKKAVDRNRLRRRLYGVLYQWSKKPSLPKATYIVITKPVGTSFSSKTHCTDLHDLLGRMAL